MPYLQEQRRMFLLPMILGYKSLATLAEENIYSKI
jgi:hypothetical protein